MCKHAESISPKPTRSSVISVSLLCHEATPACHVSAVVVRVARTRDHIAVCFRLEGELSRLRIPSPRLHRRVDGLWRHTCFEAFVALTGTSAYREFNFAPSGEWAAYAFRDYRSGVPLLPEGDPDITLRRTADALELDSVMAVASLLTTEHETVRLGLSAVVEEESGALSYWALKHPTGKPDFHHRDCFALELDP
jgi:hypothetical protein